MRTSGRTWWIVGAGLLASSLVARADSRGTASEPALGEHDPLGTGGLEGLEEDAAAARSAERSARARPPEPVDGPLLSARPGTRELRHEIRIGLEGGTARIAHRIRLSNRGTYDTPITYRLPLPPGATRASLALCIGPTSDGGPDARACVPRPVPAARRDPDALEVSIPSLPAASDAWVAIAYAAPFPARGGMRELVLPPRRGDLRAGPSLVTVEGDGPEATLVDRPAGDSPAELEAYDAVRVRSPVGERAPTIELGRSECGGAPCFSARLVTPRPPLEAEALVVLLDGSPSVEGEARNRAREVLVALRETLPPESTVRVSAFAEVSRTLVAERSPVATLDPSQVVAGTEGLGGTTRPDRAVHALLEAGSVGAHDRILIVGDGGFTSSAEASAFADELRRSGRRASYVDVGPRPARASLRAFLSDAHARYVRVADEAGEAVDTGRRQRLADALREALAREDDLVARVVSAHGRVVESVPQGAELRLVAPQPIRIEARGARTRRLAGDAGPLVGPAEARTAEGASAGLGHDVPRDTVQIMLRTQVVPVARACFRDDRRGRPRYSVRAELEFRLAEREVVDLAVHGSLPDALRACLLDAVSRMSVPRFAGTVLVHYPLRTLEAEEPATIELAPELEGRLHELFGPGEPAPGSPSDVEARTRR